MQGTKRGIYSSYPYSTAVLVKKQNITAGKTDSHSVITEGAKSKQTLFYSNKVLHSKRVKAFFIQIHAK